MQKISDKRQQRIRILHCFENLENPENSDAIKEILNEINNILNEPDQNIDLLEMSFNDCFPSIENKLNSNDIEIVKLTISILSKICVTPTFKKMNTFINSQNLDRLLNLFSEACKGGDLWDFVDQLKLILKKTCDGYNSMPTPIIKGILNEIIEIGNVMNIDIIQIFVSKTVFQKEDFSDEMCRIYNICNEGLDADDDNTVLYSVKCIDVILSKGFDDFRPDDLYNKIVDIIKEKNEEEWTQIDIVAYSISLMKYLFLDLESVKVIFEYINSKFENILKKTLETIESYSEKWLPNDELRKYIIDSMPNLLENTLYIKNMALKLLDISMTDVEELSNDTINELINLIPNAKDLNLLMKILKTICEYIIQVQELRNGYSYDDFFENLYEMEDEISEYSLDDNVSEGNKSYAYYLLTNLSDYKD